MKTIVRLIPAAVFAFACASCIIQTPGQPAARQTAQAPARQTEVAQAPASRATISPAAATAPAASTTHTMGGVAVISVTNTAGLGGRSLKQFRMVDDKLTDWVKKDLQNRGMSVVPAQTFGQYYTLAV